MPRRQSNRTALVRGNHVPLSTRIRHIRAKTLQQRIWYAGEEGYARIVQAIDKGINVNHVNVPYSWGM